MKQKPELRKYLVDKKWVVIATARAKRPDTFRQKEKIKVPPASECPFEVDKPDFQAQLAKATYFYPNKENWRVCSIPNKFPAFVHGKSRNFRMDGPYEKEDAVGFSEVIITREHDKPIALMDNGDVEALLKCFQARYIDLMHQKFIDYILIMQNHGEEAGASVYHPHAQLFAIPIISNDNMDEISGAEQYYQKNKRCSFCTIISNEKEVKKRIVFENSEFLVICPYASRFPFQMRIMPIEHQPYFERMAPHQLSKCAEALQKVLLKIYKGLNDPPYNFYIHTSPCDGRDHNYFHWHIAIMPRLSRMAGFEIGTGIEINTVAPEDAAKFLRSVKT